MRLDWLYDVLRAALAPLGYAVSEAPGARTRGRAIRGPVRWIVDHHTASSRRSGNHGSLRVLMYGRPGLPGPLCQITDGRNGDTIIVATGRANHAGYGRMPDGTNPNDTSIGRESENDGLGEPWPERQRRAQVVGDAAILRHLGRPSAAARGHREVDPGRKIDPTYDMDEHRHDVGLHLAHSPGTAPPSEEDDMTPAQEHKLDRLLASNTRIEEGQRRLARALTKVEGIAQSDLEAQLIDIAEQRAGFADDAA